jgi:hypothetical protein
VVPKAFSGLAQVCPCVQGVEAIQVHVPDHAPVTFLHHPGDLPLPVLEAHLAQLGHQLYRFNKADPWTALGGMLDGEDPLLQALCSGCFG